MNFSDFFFWRSKPAIKPAVVEPIQLTVKQLVKPKFTPAENRWVPTITEKVNHENSGQCRKCLQVLAKYPGFDAELGNWFCDLQLRFKDAHVSCGGRGKIEQEECFQRGASKAHYGESAHNYNCALDIFQLRDGNATWDKIWFADVVGSNLGKNLTWYGAPHSVFYELPHVEVSNWKEMKKFGLAELVE